MAVQEQDDQHEHTFSSYVRIRDAVLKTCLGRWKIGRSGERGSGISVLPARYDDDDYCHSFFQAAVVSILLCVCTTWSLTKRMEKELDGNYTRMLRAILNKSWRQHSTKQHLYGHLPPITKTFQVRRTRHAGNYWRNRDEIRSDILQWTPSHGRAKAGRRVQTYI